MMPDNHTSDDSDARIPEREVGLNLLVPRINVIYTKKNLSRRSIFALSSSTG
jgi:hypothetical protein